MRTPELHTRSPPAPEASGEEMRAIAAFDFDGTLTVRDSFHAFLRWRSGPWGCALNLLRLVPALAGYVGRRDRERLKSAAVRVFLKGVSRGELERQAERFAAGAAAGLLRPDALRAWAMHGERGDLRVIVTASPEEIVRPFAQRLRADALIASRLEWTGDRVGFGLDGRNCRGPEKVARLRQRFGQDVRPVDAYGDTSGDEEMLALARRGHMRVFTARP